MNTLGTMEFHSTEYARNNGVPLDHVLEAFLLAADKDGTRLIVHNIDFDDRVIGAEIDQLAINATVSLRPRFCTMRSTVKECRTPRRGGGYKWPLLQELHLHLFGCHFPGGHDAIKDVQATARCFFELRRRGLVQYG